MVWGFFPPVSSLGALVCITWRRICSIWRNNLAFSSSCCSGAAASAAASRAGAAGLGNGVTRSDALCRRNARAMAVSASRKISWGASQGCSSRTDMERSARDTRTSTGQAPSASITRTESAQSENVS